MPIGQSNSQTLGYQVESAWGTATIGTTGTPSGTKKLLNFTSESLKLTNNTTQSNFVRADTNIAGTVRTGFDTGGDIGIEFQYGGYDDFLEAAMRSSFSSSMNVTSSTAISAVDATGPTNGLYTGTFEHSSAGFIAVPPGTWIKTSGFSTAANNGWWLVTASTTSVLTVKSSVATVTEAGNTSSHRVKGMGMINSTTQKSFTFEKVFTDIPGVTDTSGLAQLFQGMRLGTFGLNFTSGAISTGSMSFIGKTGEANNNTRFSAATAAATTQSMNSINNIKQIYVGTATAGLAPATDDFTGISFQINTNPRALDKIGTLNKAAINQGSIMVTGDISLFFGSHTYLNYGINFTPIDLAIVTEDDAGNGYVFYFPQCNLTDPGSPENGGINTDLTQKLSFSATLGTTGTSSYTGSISKYPA
jgi:hypothetical protein